MAATSRELVLQTLNFQNPARAPRQLWALPWAINNFKAEYDALNEEFPPDISHANGYCQQSCTTEGDPFKVGKFKDDWGCVFENLQEGIIGEVKDPQIKDWETDIPKVHIPREWLSIQPDKVNADCGKTDKFVLGGCCPRPFEQLQFLRGTANLYMDLLAPPDKMLEFMKELHNFYCELLAAWVKTDVDGLMFMDDWGSQQSLLIQPALWREYFKPMYRDYIQIAHNAGKKAFMHSDGYILAVYPDLIELGLDALNSQVFCMGLDNLKPYAGQITFWGEIDRQHILPEATPEEVDQAVKQLREKLWRNGGCIAQCEFGPGARPENVRQVFASWDQLF